jgi:hypothetical protein
MDGFCNQNADQLGSLAGPSLLTVYVGVVECAPASLPPASSSLTHARRMDGFCNQNADQLGSLAGPSLLTVYVGVVECAPPPPTHTPPPHTGFPMSAHLSRLRLFQQQGRKPLRHLGMSRGDGRQAFAHTFWLRSRFTEKGIREKPKLT